VVEALGSGVEGLGVGDRVAYAGLPIGGYAEARIIAADRLIPVPDGISDRSAAAAMLRGITAHMLLHRIHPVGPGTTLLVHAAAGGLGLILTQWAKRLGATVIGTVGSRAKADLALSRGLDHAVLYRETDFVAETRRLTKGGGVDFACDGIGGTTLLRTLDAVRPFGTVASLGQAGGAIPPLPLAELGPRRSLCLARPSVLAYAGDLATYRIAAAAVFDQIARGLGIEIGADFPLIAAGQAQSHLERGATTGSILLTP
jgi:NADPH2:quinone reductase